MRIDKTAPTTGLLAASGTYLPGTSFNWGCADGTSGVASTVVTVDGQVVSGANASSLAMLPGTHVVSVTATDVAGNVTTDVRTYSTAGAAVVGGNLFVVGTDGGDTITVTATDATHLRVTVNGAATGYPIAPGGTLIVYGLGGSDHVVVNTNVIQKATLDGGSGDDYLEGGAGDDVLYGADGNDELVARLGNDRLEGGAGNDLLRAGQGNDLLFGGAGNDDLRGNRGNDLLDGGDGDDLLVAGDGGDVLDGGAGNDELRAGQGNDVLYGGAGNDLLRGGGGTDQLYGQDGNDVLYGGNGGDVLDGGAGHDNVKGGNGDDVLSGGDGDDVLLGGDGCDYLAGDAGRDLLIGGFGADDLNGNANDDILIAGTTDFDGNCLALDRITCEWTSSRSYSQRVSNLTGPLTNGSNVLNGVGVFLTTEGSSATVHDDGAQDRLQGDAGSDWFLLNQDGDHGACHDVVCDLQQGGKAQDIDFDI